LNFVKGGIDTLNSSPDELQVGHRATARGTLKEFAGRQIRVKRAKRGSW
jgi:hypothetical protein